MTKSELLRKMAAYIREHGFHPNYQEAAHSRCGCFCHAADVVSGGKESLTGTPLSDVLGLPLSDQDYIQFSAPRLANHGWTGPEVTADAAAACEIAADLCEWE